MQPLPTVRSLDEKLQADVLAALRKFGALRVAKALGLTRMTVLSFAVGVPDQRHATLLVVRENIGTLRALVADADGHARRVGG